MGRVEDAQNMMRKVEELERERERERLAISNSTPRVSQPLSVVLVDLHLMFLLTDFGWI